MRDIAVEVSVLDEGKAGRVLELRVQGDAESRLGGIASLVESTLSESPAAGVVFDLTDLRYISFDDIGLYSVIAATNRFTRPCCIVSRGRNRKTLCRLLDVTRLGARLGGRVFADSDAALEHIQMRPAT